MNCFVMGKSEVGFIHSKQKDINESNKLEFQYSFIEGVKYKLLGEYRNSIKWFKRCLKIDRRSSAVRFELANIYIINGDLDSAMQLLRDAIYYNSGNKWYKLQLANVYKQKSMIKQACKIYNDLYKEDSGRIEYLYMESELFLSIEDWKSALKVFELIEREQGISEIISLEKYKVYIKLEEPKAAHKELNKLIKKFPEKTEYLAMLAEVYISKNKNKKAINIFNKMLEINPENGYVYFYIADYYKSINSFEKFKEYVDIAFAKSNVNIEHKVQYLIKLYLSADKINIDKNFIGMILNKLLKTYPNNLSILSLQVDILKSEGNINTARDIIGKMLHIDKHQYKTWEQLLLLDNQINDFVSLKIHSKSAIVYFPDEPLPYLFNGISYLLEKKYSESFKILLKGEKNVINNPYLKSQFYSYIAESLYNLNRQEEAFEYFDKTIEIDPNNISVLNNYSYYLSEANINLDKAEKMISICIEKEFDNPTYLDTYAWVLFKRGKYSEALFYIKRVVELDKENSSILMEHFGDILYKNNKIEEALKAWKKSRDLGNDSKELQQKILKGKLIE